MGSQPRFAYGVSAYGGGARGIGLTFDLVFGDQPELVVRSDEDDDLFLAPVLG